MFQHTQKACRIECRCKNCGNPFGLKPKAEKIQVGQKRKRDTHHHQFVALRGKPTVTFMKEVGEPSTIGGYSKTEFLMVCSIIHTIMTDEKGRCNWECADIDSVAVHKIYISIIELTQAMGLSLSMYARTSEEINKLLKLCV